MNFCIVRIKRKQILVNCGLLRLDFFFRTPEQSWILLEKKEIIGPWEILNVNISSMLPGEILPKCELCLGATL